VIYCLDYSKFDSSVPSFLIDAAFSILKTWFGDMTQEELDCFNLVKTYFITTPIVMMDQNVYYGKRHGVPSGSYFTSLVDSIVNTILVGAISHRFGLQVMERYLQVMGDDSIFGSYITIELEKIAAFVKRYGFVINVKKSIVGQVHYLGGVWVNGAKTLPLDDLATKMVQPERFRVYPKHLGKQDRGISVMASYAREYENAFVLLPGDDPATKLWFASRARDPDPAWLSGSEFFTREYVHGRDSEKAKVNGRTLGFFSLT